MEENVLTSHEYFECFDEEMSDTHNLYEYKMVRVNDYHYLNIWVPKKSLHFLKWQHTIHRFPGAVIKNKRLDKTPAWFQLFYKEVKKSYFNRLKH